MAARCRRPARHLFTDAFADDGDADVLRMYRHTRAQTLVIRCTESGAPAVLDTELDALTAENPQVRVLRMPLTHVAPAWEAIDTPPLPGDRRGQSPRSAWVRCSAAAEACSWASSSGESDRSRTALTPEASTTLGIDSATPCSPW